jgi:hypothetical protein
MQVGEIVLFGKKARFAIMAALYDVQRYLVQMSSWTARYKV